MNPVEHADWLAALRARFVAIARRRVAPDAVEDVVQDALRVVVERGWSGPGELVDGVPGLAWCMQVLRHVIGNHYQRTRVRGARDAGDGPLAFAADPARGPLEALAAADAERVVHEALAALDGDGSPCGRWLGALAGGESPGALARAAGVAEAAFYRRLYRCREKLRALLAEKGWSV